ncbi:phage portal protein [Loigolactobacillus backii]|uniref:phage portal protein n=1 Tax=Loigolactobacillus backii TaxID=375175 RepID=UPI0007F161AC|nr:phage portal protein [Loigolactobacillus backii]ANK59823.1 phage portal protein [Loigolactobacillus backii]
MAETEDNQAHLNSLPGYPRQGSIDMLSGDRFYFDSNVVFKMPADVFQGVANDPLALSKYVTNFINQHYNNQMKRLITLERYYIGDNDIHYWRSHKGKSRADNRIASGIPSYITNIRVGYSLGNAIKFQFNKSDNSGNGDDLTNAITQFNTGADESYHEKVMKKHLSVTGRSFELLYVKQDSTDVAVKALDPSNAFVVYDTTVEQHSLFAVYYYPVTFMGKQQWYVTVYTADNIYYYKSVGAPTIPLEVDHAEPHFFGGVPITEFINNDERMGDWERDLDYIDSYDKALSEMANSQEDFNNAVLVLTGDVETNKDGHPDINRHNLIMWLKPKIVPGMAGVAPTVIQPTASYLAKQLPAADWKQYIDQLMNDIHKYTNTPDVNDANFASNASGVAMSYKLWGSDQERAIAESLYMRGLMRRYRLLGNYWEKEGTISSADEVEYITPLFTPNLPKNDDAIVTNIKALSDTGSFSDETLHDMAEPVTGIKPDEEASRIKDETTNDPNRISMPIDAQPNQGQPVVVDQTQSAATNQPDSAANPPASDTSSAASAANQVNGGGSNGTT